MQKKQQLTYEQVRSLIEYRPETGEFFRLVATSNQKKGARAGSLNALGYWQVGVGGRSYLGHRLAWLLTHGAWPESQIDHINQNRADNRLSNLRHVTSSENKQNTGPRRTNKLGIKGVHFDTRTNRWVAQIAHETKRHFLGRHKTLDGAVEAYRLAAQNLHKFNPVATQ